ncbi:MAG: FAD-binding oxidoreductase [Deltaproteobacteria bacterium]|nr:FAD-binding oxidoreductase [Deltaproteobacteria bacterium]
MESERTTLRSYSGFHQCAAELFRPRDEAELARLLADCDARGQRCTLRGSGLSLDRQALGERAISLAHFQKLAVDPTTRRATVGAGVTWGQVFDATARVGLAPAIMPTTRQGTIGGTLSAHSLSRFSPLHGREGNNVDRVRVLLPDGAARECSRDENSDLFHGVIGGFGNLGVLLEATYKLVPAPAPARVRTWLKREKGFEGLHEHLLGTDQGREVRCVVLYDDGAVLRRLDSRARLSCEEDLRRTLLYNPPGGVRTALEWAVQYWDWMGPAFWSFGYWALLREGRPYIDPLHDYTFFMEGNVGASRWARRLGLPFRVMEQTWVVPTTPGCLEAFLQRVMVECRRDRLKTAIFDVVHLPGDEEFLLSSSRALPCYAVNLAFEGLRARHPPAVERVFRALTAECRALGGRLHLVKNIWADPKDTRAMYAEVLPRFQALKRRCDPRGTLGSDFLARAFGPEDEPAGP